MEMSNSYYRWRKKSILFEGSFHGKPRQLINDVWVTPVNHIGATIAKVMDYNEPAEPADKQYLGQREEFYAWLTNMKVGSRLIRHGCDEEFAARVSVVSNSGSSQ
jgi:hypothetical protein